MGLVLPPGGEMEKGHGKWSFSPLGLPHILRKVWMRERRWLHTHTPLRHPADTQPLHLQPDPQASKVDLGDKGSAAAPHSQAEPTCITIAHLRPPRE